MKKIFLFLFLLSTFMTIHAQNLIASWSGNGDVDQLTSLPNNYGWNCSATTAPWNYANSSGGIRYYDVTTGHTFSDGTVYSGRLLYLRWDGVISASGYYTLPVTLAANSGYKFSWIYKWNSNASAPNLTVSACTGSDGTGSIGSKVFTTNSDKTLQNGDFIFATTNAGKYYLTFNASSAAMCAVGELKLVDAPPSIVSSATSIALDNNYAGDQFNITGANLSNPITITAPVGITVSPTSLAANASNVLLIVTYDGTTVVNGNIKFTSGSSILNIPVKAVSNINCFSPLYPDNTNLVDDPGVNSLTTFAGWGAREIVTIIKDSANVYCGARTGHSGNGTAHCNGSLDVLLTGKLIPNTTYRVKAVIKTVGGSYQFGIYGFDTAKGDLNNMIDTNGSWKTIDFLFVSGTTMAASQGMFLNNCNSSTGTSGYIDNWEMYVMPDPVIIVSQKSFVVDDKGGKSLTFTEFGANLKSDVTITAPAGIIVSPTTIPGGSITQQTVTITYDGTTTVNDSIVLTSGTTVTKIGVKSDNSIGCFTPLYPNKINLVSDPYMNNTTAGWGNHQLISSTTLPDSVFCGMSCGRIIGSGDFDVILTGKMKPNTSYIAKAMVMTFGGNFQIGVWGMDSVNTADRVDSIIPNGVWHPITFNFTTGIALKAGVQGMFINNLNLKGNRAFIDNWELYEAVQTGIANVSKQFKNIYVKDGKIVADFDLDNSSIVRFAIYSIQGSLISEESTMGSAGRNEKVLNANLLSGVYLVRMTQNGQSEYKKVIK